MQCRLYKPLLYTGSRRLGIHPCSPPLKPTPQTPASKPPRVSGAFYTTVSWLAKDLRTYGYPLIKTQGLLITSLIPNAIGLWIVGRLIDSGVRPLRLNAAIVVIGVGLGFAVFKCVGQSLGVAWGLVCLFHLVIGGAMANVALPCTRIYEPLQVRGRAGWLVGYFGGSICGQLGGWGVGVQQPASLHQLGQLLGLLIINQPLRSPNGRKPTTTIRIHQRNRPPQRTTGFAFGYNFGYGILGGLSPLAVAAIKATLPLAYKAFAPAFWLLVLGGFSMIGCVGLGMYMPRLTRPHVGKIE